MTGYGDTYKDIRQAHFLDRWAPLHEMPELSETTLRFNVARARAAEHELRELKAALRTLNDAIRRRGEL